MHRVVTQFRDRHGTVVRERGPWHPKRDDAEVWAEILRCFGYVVQVESHRGALGGGGGGDGNQELAQALASMA